MSFREQVLALHEFKRGNTNCLFTTPVAEEGIDVPDCDLVIRFDLYNSVIQYLQSKGRARQARSRYITMMEEGNLTHIRSAKQALRDSQALEKFCLYLSADRKLHDDLIDEDMEMMVERMQHQVYKIPSTGARLTFPASLEILARFVSHLSTDSYAKVEYQVQKVGDRYLADVVMPLQSPVNFVKGTQQRSKLLAKCSAAFEACKILIRDKHVDGNLQPTFKKKVHAMRNARLAVSSNKKADYDMRLRPEIWAERGEWTECFATTITIKDGDALRKAIAGKSLILLSRKPIPKLPGVPLFFGNGNSSIAELTPNQDALQLSPEEADGLTKFTHRVFADVFSKEYDTTSDQYPYLLAPYADSPQSDTRSHIDWDVVNLVSKNEVLEWENAPEDFFVNKLVTDPYDGGRKLVIKGIDKTKKPSDPTPEGVPESRSRAYRSVEPTIMQYSNSLYYKSRQRVKWRDDQPVVKAELLSLRRNLLDEFEVDEKVNMECFIILEPLHVSPVS